MIVAICILFALIVGDLRESSAKRERADALLDTMTPEFLVTVVLTATSSRCEQRDWFDRRACSKRGWPTPQSASKAASQAAAHVFVLLVGVV